MKQDNSVLFSSYKLGQTTLKNRVVMAPMTRSRAIGNIPNDMMAKYYSDRAEAGLIITEGVSPSPNGLGYPRIPGCYTSDQIAGWKKVADAVHQTGGKIFMQIMHTGRIGHTYNLPEGAKLVSASDKTAAGEIWTDTHQMQPHTQPEAINTDDIAGLIAEYVHSAKGAIEAGFDGVEIHAANGYLPMQFLSPGSNQRTDKYGGSHENRNRFVLELTQAVADAIGKDKVGIRLSPFNVYNDMTPDENEEAQYIALAEGLGKLGITYMHLITFVIPEGLISAMKKAFGGTVILNGGYTNERAEADLAAGNCELVSFGAPYTSNPDLVSRMMSGKPLTAPDPATFFTPGEQGYNDFSFA